jgi:predicted ATPase
VADSEAAGSEEPYVRVAKLRLRHYRSVRDADISIPRGITYLVGANGSGKSNVMDGLRLVSDALTTSLDQALRERGGIQEIRWRGRGRPGDVTIEVHLVGPRIGGRYVFTIRSERRGGFAVFNEECWVWTTEGQAHFQVSPGSVVSSEQALPLPAADRLYLVTAASLPAFRPIFDALSRMGFYNLNPAVIREPQAPDAGDLLARDGRNIASVIHRLAEAVPEAKKLVEDYLSVIVPGIVGVDRRSALGSSLETIEFRQELVGRSPLRFYAQSMSDGTLRALGVLVAAFQRSDGDINPSLIGIEEPEASVHPAAAAVLRDALAEASQFRQVLVTTHSPDLLDDRALDPNSILAVESRYGESIVGRPDDAGLSALRDRLYTAGELLRVGQLFPASTQRP